MRYPPWHFEGRRVRQGDVCNRHQAVEFLRFDLDRVERGVDLLTIDGILPRQFDALVCLTYNIGEVGFKESTVRRLVNANPLDPNIRGAFMLWYKDNGVPVKGLWNRRHREADHYMGVSTPCPPFPHLRAA